MFQVLRAGLIRFHGRPFGLFILLLSAGFLLLPPETPAKGRDADSGPIKITSERLVASKKDGEVTFNGNVVARHKDGTIISDSLKVHYGDDDAVEKIVATGNVKINQQDRVGVCERATFYPDDKKIVMTGEPRVWKDGDVVTGKVITIFGDSDRMDVEGASIVIQPREKEQEAVPSP